MEGAALMKILRARMVPLACVAFLAAVAGLGCSDDDDGGVGPGEHETIELEIASGYDGIINTWPGPDGLVGTADDSVQASASATAGSETNNVQSFSYTAFDFGATGTTETGLLPTGYIAISFLEGEVIVDHTALDEGGGPIITSLQVTGGTEPTTGHGDYTASITEVNSGTYDPITKEFTLNVDFTASLIPGTGSAVNLTLTGEAWIIHSADFGDETGNAYLDSVLIPIADSLGIEDLFFADATGTVPASTPPGIFPTMPIRTVIVAVKDD